MPVLSSHSKEEDAQLGHELTDLHRHFVNANIGCVMRYTKPVGLEISACLFRDDLHNLPASTDKDNVKAKLCCL